MRISHAEANNVLIVSAPASEQEKIRQLIDRVDVASQSRLEQRFYTPKRLETAGLLETLRSLHGADGKTTFTLAGGDRTIVAFAPRSRSRENRDVHRAARTAGPRRRSRAAKLPLAACQRRVAGSFHAASFRRRVAKDERGRRRDQQCIDRLGASVDARESRSDH